MLKELLGCEDNLKIEKQATVCTGNVIAICLILIFLYLTQNSNDKKSYLIFFLTKIKIYVNLIYIF